MKQGCEESPRWLPVALIDNDVMRSLDITWQWIFVNLLVDIILSIFLGLCFTQNYPNGFVYYKFLFVCLSIII